MGQLIDKTVLRKELSKLPSEMGFVRKSDVMQILGSQNCAYNIDKVVKELEETHKRFCNSDVYKRQIIWLPFDEEWSSFNKRLTELGYRVVRSSLAEGQDFFKYEPEHWDLIVSNPPFSIKDKVLERLYSFNKPFAVLLPLNSLQGKTRYKYFKDGIQILSFDARICYHDKDHMDSVVKGSPFATAYFLSLIHI